MLQNILAYIMDYLKGIKVIKNLENGKDIIASKIQRYSQELTVKNYDSHRFGTKSGQLINKREINYFKYYLKDIRGKILDIACGTGRITAELIQKDRTVISLDSSMNMLKITNQIDNSIPINADLFNLPFSSDSFDALSIGRLFQHFNDLEKILSETLRIVRPKGFIAFDTFAWSPRQVHFHFSKNSPLGVFPHSSKQIKQILSTLNLKLVRDDRAFLLPPGLLKPLPVTLFRLLEKLEVIVPEKLLARHFWLIQKP